MVSRQYCVFIFILPGTKSPLSQRGGVEGNVPGLAVYCRCRHTLISGAIPLASRGVAVSYPWAEPSGMCTCVVSATVCDRGSVVS